MSASGEFFAFVDAQRGYCTMPVWVGMAEQLKLEPERYGRRWRAECAWIAARRDGILDRDRYQSNEAKRLLEDCR